MKQLLNTLLFSIVFISISAQTTTNYLTPQDAAQMLVNPNSSIQIISSTWPGLGAPNQLGSFSGASALLSTNAFSSGVIISTGHITVANCTNQAGQTAPCGPQYWNVEANTFTGLFDNDLFAASPGTQFDPFIWEIEFIALSNKIEFSYVFASEEYKEYVNTSFNDAFGFFLSGPGIIGPYSNNGINLAVVPGTNLPINIHNINNNSNTSYFVDNNCNPLAPDFNAPCPYPSFSYDGFTRALVASYDQLVCGETYKLKLVISNINDFRVGSAVFLKEGGLQGALNAGPAVASPNPVCEGGSVSLSCAGSPVYSYTWYAEGTNQQVGTGQTITTTATQAALPYYVVATDPAGCVGGVTIPVDLTVHTPINQAPYTLGIDNTNEYVYYAMGTAQNGPPFSFDIFSYDDLNENVILTYANLPNGITATIINNITSQNGNQQSINISGSLTQGEYQFQIILTDNNGCGNLSQTINFKIIVVCPNCPIDVKYEKRGGANSALPALTNAVHYVVAGNDVDPSQTDGPVIVNSKQSVTFRAGTAIFLEDGFSVDAGATFFAEIHPAECISECSPEECCIDGFTGDFTFDFIPNVFTPNGDGVNDVWFLPDTLHPLCAFNIMGFELDVYKGENAWGNNVLSKHENSTSCCFFTSPGPGESGFSSIYWNGKLNNTGNLVPSGQYYFTLKLIGCDRVEKWYSGPIAVF